MVDKDGLIVEKSQAGFLYADDVCLLASNEQDLQRIVDSISGCISEYGMKLVKIKIKSDVYIWSEERENVDFFAEVELVR